MIRHSLLYVLLLTPASLFAASVMNPDATCESKADCVAVESGGCSGGWSIVNKAHEAAYIKRARDMNAAIECAHAPEFQPRPELECVKKTCTSKKN